MGKWRSSLFLFDGSIICAQTYRGLGMVRAGTGKWKLIHIRSQESLLGGSGDYSSVRSMFSVVCELEQWSNYGTKEEILAIKDISRRIAFVGEAFSSSEVVCNG